MGKRRAKSYKTKRKNGLKAAVLNHIVDKPLIAKRHAAIVQGLGMGSLDSVAPKNRIKNAFLCPDDDTAVFPQVEIDSMDDLRSEAVGQMQISLLEEGTTTVQNRRANVA